MTRPTTIAIVFWSCLRGCSTFGVISTITGKSPTTTVGHVSLFSGCTICGGRCNVAAARREGRSGIKRERAILAVRCYVEISCGWCRNFSSNSVSARLMSRNGCRHLCNGNCLGH